MAERQKSGRTPRFATRLRALVELSRPGNVAMAAVGCAIGAIVAGLDRPTLELGLAVAATALVTVGGNALNDITDRRIDETAHPGRPLPSGRLPISWARTTAWLGFTLAPLLAYPVGFGLLALVLAAEAMLGVYEAWFKAQGLLGNLVVATLVGLTFLAGALAAGGVTRPVGFLAGLALLANVGREAFKDAEDVAHDEGRRTIAHRWGTRGAIRFARVATLMAIVLSPLPYLIGFGGWPYLATVAVADVLFLGAALVPSPGKAQRVSKAAMLAALAAFTIGGAV